ncbi:FAD-binding domain-containing protein [Thozetella sp. PMI_491]|nr:FAD-binding domain-containing protein [Thozetella sp. PMI_491]
MGRFTTIALSLCLSLPCVWSCKEQCRNIPGDTNWPRKNDWDALNSTISGRLIATVPAASVCHGPGSNEHDCAALKQEWDFPQPHIFKSGEIMSPYWQNQSCDPFTPASSPCTLGNYVSYSINVTGVDDVKAGIFFAREHNIRLVIKNTGHDYLGRSTGKGGLGLWMQHLKYTNIIKTFSSEHYNGPAMEIGAGVLSADAYASAREHGLRVVGGGCPSVGIAGGYSQGGGHSFLTSTYGLSADNVLRWEVVTAAGDHIVATPTEHQDLYWALSGGGGGNYAVVLSMTVKAHQDGPVSGAYMSFNASSVGFDKFWEGVDAFHALLPSVVDAGATALYQIMDGSFVLLTMTAPNLSQGEVLEFLAPLVSKLDNNGVPYVLVPNSFDHFYDQFSAMFAPLPFGPIPVSDIISSRLIPRSTITERPEEASRTLRGIVEGQSFYLGIAAMNANRTAPGTPENAVLPAWRSMLLQVIVGSPWDWSIPREEMMLRNDVLTKRVMPSLEALAPGSGVYMNEGNVEQENWQHQFFGENYPRLLSIKKKYDPEGLFYAVTAVGSEAWTADEDGRLCRKATSGHDEL